MPGEIKALVREEDPQRTTVIFTLSGTLWGEPVEKDCSVEVFWNKEQCDRCNRISGNYYEGVIQVRAEGRRPTPTELAAAQRIAAEVEETMQQRGERLSVIVREEETKDGLDLIVSSHQIGDEVAGSIVRAMGGRVTTHPKLAGERAGRPLYRVTYAVRLPNLTKGDIIWLNRTYGKVIEPGSRTFRYIDLNTGSVRVRRSADIQRLVGNIRDAEETIVAYVEGPVIGVLDPDSGATLECQAASWRKVLAGDRVKVLKDQDHLVIV
jgi:nonsense-mediated mRNA decay protein 3